MNNQTATSTINQLNMQGQGQQIISTPGTSVHQQQFLNYVDNQSGLLLEDGVVEEQFNSNQQNFNQSRTLNNQQQQQQPFVQQPFIPQQQQLNQIQTSQEHQQNHVQSHIQSVIQPQTQIQIPQQQQQGNYFRSANNQSQQQPQQQPHQGGSSNFIGEITPQKVAPRNNEYLEQQQQNKNLDIRGGPSPAQATDAPSTNHINNAEIGRNFILDGSSSSSSNTIILKDSLPLNIKQPKVYINLVSKEDIDLFQQSITKFAEKSPDLMKGITLNRTTSEDLDSTSIFSQMKADETKNSSVPCKRKILTEEQPEELCK